jgi:23S rRNA pseudouridine1911/1915/1917 synthase
MSRRYPSKTAEGRIGHHLATTEETTLIECLVRQFDLTSDVVQHLVSFGSVYVERKRVSSDQPLTPGQYVRVHLLPKRYPVGAIDWNATIVHLDEACLVVNKPAGIPVHATLDNRAENVAHQLSAALGAPVYVTQRLDAAVSGLIVFARTQEFQKEFNRLLRERQVKKRYRALVTSPPEVGRHIHYMEPVKHGPKTVVIDSRPDWLECALRVVHVAPAGPAFDVEIDLETGRTHQIRAQLSALGSPILGDKLYGSIKPYEVNGVHLPGLALFSASTSWSYPAGTAWSFELSPPWQLPTT